MRASKLLNGTHRQPQRRRYCWTRVELCHSNTCKKKALYCSQCTYDTPEYNDNEWNTTCMYHDAPWPSGGNRWSERRRHIAHGKALGTIWRRKTSPQRIGRTTTAEMKRHGDQKHQARCGPFPSDYNTRCLNASISATISRQKKRQNQHVRACASCFEEIDIELTS